MDQRAAFDQSPTYTNDCKRNTVLESPRLRDRRREKQLLSCTFCRNRKVRCDRQLPCKTCVAKGLALSCTYEPSPQQKSTVSVSERIKELEALVRSLAEQQQQQQQQTSQTPGLSVDSSDDSPTHSFQGAPGKLPPDPSATPMASASEDSGYTTAEHGSMRIHAHGVNYVSSVHWAAVLHSISELKDHYEKEEEVRKLDIGNDVPHHSSGPRLLYEPIHVTKADILTSIPTRPVVDRMVARYFIAQGVIPVILHSGQFLKEYESFWQDPAATSFAWIGLLLSIMCLSTQQQLTKDPMDSNTLMRVYAFRERTVHCLTLGQFAKGGTHMLETMINHLACEAILCRDTDIELWFLLGMIVQLALSLGYNREPRNFPKISEFDGEMRRRVWAAIVQMDLRLSSQLGLPHLLKLQHCDTAEPHNLLDSDFDQATVKLPPSRPETEVTPVLYGLAKNRIDSISALISDAVADTRSSPYIEIMDLDQKLHEAEASLPPIFQWQPLSQSFTVPPQIILYRIWLQVSVQRAVIWLHRKYLTPSYTQVQCQYSRNSCVQAAIKLLEFQQLLDEEMRPDGQLHSVCWMQSSLIKSTFLLGMSVLCYYIQLSKTMPDVPLDQHTRAKIFSLLRNTYSIWQCERFVSRDAWKVVEYLSRLLGLREHPESASTTQEARAHQNTPQNADASLDQVTWDVYQDYIANFPAAFDANFLPLDVSGASYTVPNLMDDSLLANVTGPDR